MTMTARQLGIEQWELDRLVEVRDRMVRDGWTLSMGEDAPHGSDDPFCGSVVCLGGNMFALQNPPPSSSSDVFDWACGMSEYVLQTHSDPLYGLFFPQSYLYDEEWMTSWNRIPESAVVDAIDIFLKKGRVSSANWKRLRKKHGLKEESP